MDDGLEIPVMEHFYTLQGEGVFSGRAAYFIRLGGCDVGCTWCDVKESWPIETHAKIHVEVLWQHIATTPTRMVVITGGEPFMHNLTNFTQFLKNKGCRLHVETSGAHPLTGTWDWICLSPKKFKKPLDEFYTVANELKIIVYNKSDFDFALQNKERIRCKDCAFILQPEWDRREQQHASIVEFIKQHPEWRLSLQTHKYLHIP